MRLLSLLAITFCSVACIASPNLYIGGSAGIAFPTSDFGGEDIESQEGAAERGTALQAEVGLHGEIYDLYVGIREDNFPASAFVEDTVFTQIEIDGSWKAPRLMYGARLHLTSLSPNLTDPILGLAFTYGATTAEANALYRSYGMSGEQTTLHVPGVMLEAGAIFGVGKGVNGIVTLQYHNFTAELEDYVYDPPFFSPVVIDADDVKVTYIVLNLGLRFKLIG